MAINKNHEFEELSGVKCAIVERNASPERSTFLKQLLEFNGYTVVVVATPQKPVAAPAAAKPAVVAGEGQPPAEEITAPATPFPPQPETFTVGVTDVTFNPINAIFGRLLQTPDRHIVTLAFWNQKEVVPKDDIPYFLNK